MRLNVKREFIHKAGPKNALKAIFKGMFAHENRIRALEGKQPITKQQFISALRDMLKEE